MSQPIVLTGNVSELDPPPEPEPSPALPSSSGSGSSRFRQIPFQETRGPRIGVQITLPQASTILQRHLNCDCTALEYIERGYNNRTYIATASSGTEYIIRLCGRYWDRWKTEREVATLCFLRLCGEKNDTSCIPVPKVYGFCSSKQESGIGHEYILMERVPGVPLEKIWKTKPSLENKKHIIGQLAGVLRTLRSITFDKIGSLTLAPALGDTFGIGIDPMNDITLTDIFVGQHSDIKSGPFTNYVDYERAAITSALGDLKTTPYMVSSLDLVPHIEKFLQDQFKTTEQTAVFTDASMVKPAIALVHGDFEPRNIMVDPESLQITAVLDWEFAGAFPYYEDWFAGFEAFGAICDEAWAFDEPPTDPDDYDPLSEELTQNRELLFEALTAVGLPTPAQMPWLRLYAELWHFRWSISPWWLGETVVPPPTKWEDDKAKAKARVESVLHKYS